MTHPHRARKIVLVAGLMAASLLAGCGLAGTATSTATEAQAAAQEAREGKKTEAQVQLNLQQARDAAAAQRDAAEKDSR